MAEEEITPTPPAPEEPAAKSEESGKKSSPLFVIVLVLINVLFMGGVAGIIYYAHQQEMNKETIDDVIQGEVEGLNEGQELVVEQNADPTLYGLESFVVNLSGQKGARYIRVTMELSLSDAEVEEQIEARLPQIRDIIIILLSSKTYEDIESNEGKRRLRDEIRSAINSTLPGDGEVTNIFYTQFLVH
jgi:flagellar FliL protein